LGLWPLENLQAIQYQIYVGLTPLLRFQPHLVSQCLCSLHLLFDIHHFSFQRLAADPLFIAVAVEEISQLGIPNPPLAAQHKRIQGTRMPENSDTMINFMAADQPVELAGGDTKDHLNLSRRITSTNWIVQGGQSHP